MLLVTFFVSTAKSRQTTQIATKALQNGEGNSSFATTFARGYSASACHDRPPPQISSARIDRNQAGSSSSASTIRGR